MRPRPHSGQAGSTQLAETVLRGLLRKQFPQWAHLPVRPVPHPGWDNRSFRLGEDMLVRLPSAEIYAAQVETEQRWLPFLAPRLPVRIPVPVGRGHPGEGYPWPWSIYRWIEGETATLAAAADSAALASDLAAFLLALQAIDATGGPAPGGDNFHRGGRLVAYDGEVREALRRIDVPGALPIWQAALASEWRAHPVWVHGDVAVGNLLLQGERLCGVIDFGQLAVGDPACDLSIAWTVFRGESRRAFQEKLAFDEGTWLRSRAWALWKGLIVAAGLARTNAAEWADPWRALSYILES
jgi:aminoglycoside phosphotransferase (APT) family kinase protein